MNSINTIDIKELAKKYGTPLYVYNKDHIEEKFNTLNNSFKKYFSDFHIHYAIKANTNIQIIKALKDCGAGAECASPGEMAFALKAGYEADEIFYSSNYESFDDLSYISKHKPILNLDDIESYKRLRTIYIPKQVSFRINPGVGRGGHEGITTGGEKAKFGIPLERAIEAYRLAVKDGVQNFGIHTMIGSNNLDHAHFEDVFLRLLDITKKIFNDIGKKPEFINIGGGIGIPYASNEAPFNTEEMVKNLHRIYKENWDSEKFGDPTIMMEPGRYFVGEAGIIISKVTSIKDIHENYAGINAGMNTLIRPALYGSAHRMSVYNKTDADTRYNVCGQVCENTDVFARNVLLPKLEVDDLLIIHEAGAYGFVMSSTYNNRPRPAEVMIEGNSYRLIRKAQTIDDLINEQLS